RNAVRERRKSRWWRDDQRRGRRSPCRAADRAMRTRAVSSTTAVVVTFVGVLIAATVAVGLGYAVIPTRQCRRRSACHAAVNGAVVGEEQQSRHEQSTDSAMLSPTGAPSDDHMKIIGTTRLRVKSTRARVRSLSG